ncbi:unnamed protein product [Ostreobium quekettii]|uniref:RING-type domain-containing protein n=1 Tax=Ostreobium quekettii TaxID=121088 RepID=A0A8S1IPE2_9CHLO|nr:unnamed protein product [Ostreobium quekettii]|eukprot:evm.model.scf_2435EXC.2 EVM.evm.TU.scf_2435EXC.2   scf_2435EXC:15588-18394(-)
MLSSVQLPERLEVPIPEGASLFGRTRRGLRLTALPSGQPLWERGLDPGTRSSGLFLVSREQAVIVRMGEVLQVLDLDSRNGTYAGTEGPRLRLEARVVRSGEVVGFGGPVGETPFAFVWEAQVGSAGMEVIDLTGEDCEAPNTEDCEACPAQHDQAQSPTPPKPGSINVNGLCDDLREDLQCTICMDWLVGAHRLCCGHVFCAQCLLQWLQQNLARMPCPTCRKLVTAVPVPDRVLDSVVESMLQRKAMPTDERNTLQERLEKWWREEVVLKLMMPCTNRSQEVQRRYAKHQFETRHTSTGAILQAFCCPCSGLCYVFSQKPNMELCWHVLFQPANSQPPSQLNMRPTPSPQMARGAARHAAGGRAPVHGRGRQVPSAGRVRQAPSAGRGRQGPSAGRGRHAPLAGRG